MSRKGGVNRLLIGPSLKKCLFPVKRPGGISLPTGNFFFRFCIFSVFHTK